MSRTHHEFFMHLIERGMDRAFEAADNVMRSHPGSELTVNSPSPEDLSEALASENPTDLSIIVACQNTADETSEVSVHMEDPTASTEHRLRWAVERLGCTRKGDPGEAVEPCNPWTD